MKDFISTTYTFTPGASAAGTVNLSGIASFDIKKLVSIINQTRGVVIYATGSATTKYTALSGSTLTLFVDTSTHSSGDVLQVIYNDSTQLLGLVTISNPTETGLAKDVTLGSLTETAPANDTASSGLNGRLQRIAQRITSLITALGNPFQAGGSIGNTAFGLNTGSNIIGRVGIDQTTNGITNRVNVGTDGQIATNGTVFFFSTVNSSSTQLASSAIFTGAVESIVNQQSYSILFFSDQNATITVNQFIDVGGTKNIQQLTFTYLAGSKFARSGVANGNYFQVIVQNTGGSTTTTLQLDTAYGTIPSATQLNNIPSALNEINGTIIDSNSGNRGAGTQRVTIATDDINLAAINTDLGALADAAATTDTGSFSIISLIKRGLQNWTTILSRLTLGQQSAASSLSVTTSTNLTDLQNQTYNVAGVITINTDLIILDCLQLRSVMIQCLSMGTTGVVSVSWSNDGTTYDAATTNILTPAGVGTATISAAGRWFTPVFGRYMRLRLTTATTAGTTTFNVIGSQTVLAQGLNPSVSQTGTWTVQPGNTTNTSPWLVSSNMGFNSLISDVVSAALTTTTTTAAITPTFGFSYEINIPVTAVSGTTPTLQITVQESDDSGTNWYDVYIFPTITTTGIYRSPTLPNTGNRIRYVQTVTGTTPSFTRAINRVQSNNPVAKYNTDWSFASASGGITNTSDVVLASAAGATFRRYITAITIQNASAVTATEVVLKDGSTIIWRGYVGTQALLNSVVGITFPTPLKTTLNTALNFACITTAAQVYVNAQGYIAP